MIIAADTDAPWRPSSAPSSNGVDSFDNHRLLKPIGNVPSAEAEAAYYEPRKKLPSSPPDSDQPAFGKAEAVHSS